MWLAIIVVALGGVVTLLVAAGNKHDDGVCTGYDITLAPEKETYYVSREDILLEVEKVAGGTLKGRKLASLKLQEMERTLEKNNWIADAQLFVDRGNQLRIIVEERTPVARFINTAGISFYADRSGYRLDFIPGKPVRLHVVTGITAAKKWHANDSVIYKQALQIVNYISENPFWNAQVGQVEILAGRQFQLIPLVGDAPILFGSGENVQDKFHRLELFYKQVLSKAGVNKYAAIDVRYEGQVVGIKKGKAAVVDSVQLQKNIEQFLKEKQQQDAAAVAVEQLQPEPATAVPVNHLADPETKPIQAAAPVSKVPAAKKLSDNSGKPQSHPSPVPVKTTSNPIPKRTIGEKPKEEKPKATRLPKAVMPKKQETVENDY